MVEAGEEGVKGKIPVDSEGWRSYGEALRQSAIPDSQARWYVNWVRRFRDGAVAVPPGDRTAADVERFLSSLLEDPRFELWQVDQASEALRLLYQQVLPAPWARPWPRLARLEGARIARRKVRPAPTPAEARLLLRLRTEVRLRHYTPKTERAYVGWALR